MKIRSRSAYCLWSAKCLSATTVRYRTNKMLSLAPIWTSRSQFTLLTHYLFEKEFLYAIYYQLFEISSFITTFFFKNLTHFTFLRCVLCSLPIFQITLPQNCVFERDVLRLQPRFINVQLKFCWGSAISTPQRVYDVWQNISTSLRGTQLFAGFRMLKSVPWARL
jgi:hypothetical protein